MKRARDLLFVCLVLITFAQVLKAQNVAQSGLERLLELAAKSTPNEWAELLMQADSEAVKMERRQPDPRCVYRCVKINPYTLVFRWSEIGHQEVYQHDLLKIVVLAHRGTRSGAQALARLLEPGCGPLSTQWAPYFKTVIDILEFPPWRDLGDADLLRILAEAYETWWSLSKALPTEPILKDDGLTPQDFQKGAEQARLNAIAAYKEVIAKLPNDQEAAEHLRSLQENRDKHQLKWFCSGD